MKKNDDKTLGSILFGVLFVLVIKIIPLVMDYFFKDFSAAHSYIVDGISGVIAVFVSFTIVNKFFVNPFSKSDKK